MTQKQKSLQELAFSHLFSPLQLTTLRFRFLVPKFVVSQVVSSDMSKKKSRKEIRSRAEGQQLLGHLLTGSHSRDLRCQSADPRVSPARIFDSLNPWEKCWVKFFGLRIWTKKLFDVVCKTEEERS